LTVFEPRGRRDGLPKLLETVLEPLLLAEVRKRQTAGTLTPDSPRARRWKFLTENTKALYTAGVPFGVGTDAGVTGAWHGWATLHEIQLLVEGGLTPVEALTAATSNAARALRVDAERGSVAAGKLADLVLVEGAPHRNINDLERIRRVWLGGREIDRAALARAIATTEPTPLPARPAPALLDDFERTDGRSALDTLWENSTDTGHDHSRMSFERTIRPGGGHALTLLAAMAQKDGPYVAVELPLSPGGIDPVDASLYEGVEFEARGEGDYAVSLEAGAVRDFAYPAAPFRARGEWSTTRISFSAFRQARTRTPVRRASTDLRALLFEIARPPGAKAWLELDNIRFYK
jgi:hypothetical protein